MLIRMRAGFLARARASRACDGWRCGNDFRGAAGVHRPPAGGCHREVFPRRISCPGSQGSKTGNVAKVDGCGGSFLERIGPAAASAGASIRCRTADPHFLQSSAFSGAADIGCNAFAWHAAAKAPHPASHPRRFPSRRSPGPPNTPVRRDCPPSPRRQGIAKL